jgi:hypothetical protein
VPACLVIPFAVGARLTGAATANRPPFRAPLNVVVNGHVRSGCRALDVTVNP